MEKEEKVEIKVGDKREKKEEREYIRKSFELVCVISGRQSEKD